jgi:8-oxo-dGTP pyrophosphatase MutT (NUDIX family)
VRGRPRRPPVYSRAVDESATAEPAPRPAATVVLIRSAPDRVGLQVLLLRRSSQLVFYGGAWVFPGGRIDGADGDAADAERAARTAAVRELREESGLTVVASELVHFAQWLTPPGRPRRFDTWYFAARAPEGIVQVDRGEVDDHRWMTPREALQARAGGAIELPPPTFVTLSQLAVHADADAAYEALRCAGLRRYVPRPCEVEDGIAYLYEGDAGYAAREPQAPGARHRLTALAQGWRYEVGG